MSAAQILRRRLRRAPPSAETPGRPTAGAHVPAAAEILGRDHPLVRAEQRVRWLARQAGLLATFTAASIPTLRSSAAAVNPVLLGGAFVECVLLLALATAAGAVRQRAIELIAEGRGALPLASVQRERTRLLRPSHLRRLAAAIDALRQEARCPYRGHPLHRPLYVPAVIRQVDGELAHTAALLRHGQLDATTVAQFERLLGGPTSPLYGEDLRRLQEELHRIRFAAGDTNPRADPARGARAQHRSVHPVGASSLTQQTRGLP